MEQRTFNIKNFLRITDPNIQQRRMTYPPEQEHVDVVFRRQWASTGTGIIPNASYRGKIKLYH